MKINENFLLREVAGNAVVVPVGDAADRFSGMIKLNESTIKVLRLNDMDSIESFQSDKRPTIVPALLSALGIRESGE